MRYQLSLLKFPLEMCLAHLGVLLETEHDLWSSVPSGRNVFRHVSVDTTARNRGLGRTSETKVADLGTE